MIVSLDAPGSRTRDWHNYDYVNRATWLAWPWPEPRRQPLRERIGRLLTRVAGLVATLPPDWQSNRADARP
jgi:hypothetical protein